MSSVFLLTSVATVWLILHQIVRHRFADLRADLPCIYESAITAPPNEEGKPQLMALCVDLMRKAHSAVPYAALTPKEQTMVLHARAAEVLPAWMSRYAALWLSTAERKMIAQLRRVKSSKPVRPQQHFGAIKRQRQLRSAPKT